MTPLLNIYGGKLTTYRKLSEKVMEELSPYLPATKIKNSKNKSKNFKLVIKGEISLELLNSFVSLDIRRDGNALKLISFEVIKKDLSENN